MLELFVSAQTGALLQEFQNEIGSDLWTVVVTGDLTCLPGDYGTRTVFGLWFIGKQSSAISSKTRVLADYLFASFLDLLVA